MLKYVFHFQCQQRGSGRPTHINIIKFQNKRVRLTRLAHTTHLPIKYQIEAIQKTLL